MLALMANRVSTDVHGAADLRDFGAWMASEQKRIFLLCRRILQDPDEADSATQDVFLKAYKALGKRSAPVELDIPAKWVTRIAVNTCLDRLRSRQWKLWQRRPTAAEEERILQTTPSAGAGAEALLFAKQIQRRLELALANLSARQRTVFALRHFDAMPLDEIADVLKLDVGSVKAHLFRAISKLRGELRDLYTP